MDPHAFFLWFTYVYFNDFLLVLTPELLNCSPLWIPGDSCVCVCLSLSRCIKLHIYIHWGWSISLSQSIRLYHSLSFSCSISFIIYLEHPSPRISAGFGSQGTSFISHYIDCMALSLGLANCRNLLRGTGSTTSPQPGAWRAFVGECLGNPTVSWGPRVTRFNICIAMLT